MEIIYLIQAEGTDNYKIGISQNPHQRLEQLQTGNGLKLIFVQGFETKYGTKLESRMHLHFADKRIEGEWFVLRNEDVMNFESTCKKHEVNFDVLKDNHFVSKLFN